MIVPTCPPTFPCLPAFAVKVLLTSRTLAIQHEPGQLSKHARPGHATTACPSTACCVQQCIPGPPDHPSEFVAAGSNAGLAVNCPDAISWKHSLPNVCYHPTQLYFTSSPRSDTLTRLQLLATTLAPVSARSAVPVVACSPVRGQSFHRRS